MDLRELYQEVIVDHGRRPRNFGKLSDFNRSADGFNPLCGDKLKVYVNVDAEDVITDISFEGVGCAISQASASLMTEALKGKKIAHAELLAQSFRSVVMEEAAPPQAVDLGKLAVLTGVKDYPSRIKCATLAWHTLHAALAGSNQPASTE